MALKLFACAAKIGIRMEKGEKSLPDFILICRTNKEQQSRVHGEFRKRISQALKDFFNLFSAQATRAIFRCVFFSFFVNAK